MNKLLSRTAMAFLLAASCFLVTGCGEGPVKPTETSTSAAGGEEGSAAKSEGSAAKEEGSAAKDLGSGSK